jgi:hypothetical protein
MRVRYDARENDRPFRTLCLNLPRAVGQRDLLGKSLITSLSLRKPCVGGTHSFGLASIDHHHLVGLPCSSRLLPRAVLHQYGDSAPSIDPRQHYRVDTADVPGAPLRLGYIRQKRNDITWPLMVDL